MTNKPKIKLLRPSEPKRYDRERADASVLKKTSIVMLICGILLFLPLVWQLFQLMILDHNKYETLAIDNQTRSTAISASRGTIYDRNMNVLAASTTVETVFLDPLELYAEDEATHKTQDVNMIARRLAEILDLDPAFILEQASDTKMRYKIIARKQPIDVADRVREFIENEGGERIRGVYLEPDTMRYYPSGSLAAQLIGFTNAENKGAEGLEAYYDATLRGNAGAVITTKGNRETAMPYSYEKYYEATDGNSLILTIDSTVQYYLEKSLQNAIKKYDVQHGAIAVMMDVNTGAILGMATEGGYDPNNYLEIVDTSVLAELQEIQDEMKQLREGSAEYEALKKEYNDEVVAARLAQWRNRCVSDGYEPGSTFKTITLAAALESGAVDLDNRFYCGGAKDYPDRDDTLHCWKETGHGSQNTATALQNSCNIAFADIGVLLGGDNLYNYIESFGLMSKTGVDMSGEGYGVFHTREALRQNAQLTTVAFGQSIKVTPIAMIRAVAAVVNGGYVLQPYVVDQIIDQDGSVIQKNSRTVLRQAISEETSKTMCSLIESVVTDGTAGNAELPGFRVGGKTGTSEKLDKRDESGELTKERIVSFVGVAPMDHPQYIVLVALDTPSTKTGIYISGGVMAAPVVRDIFADTLLYLGVQPDYTDVDMRTVNVIMPDVRGYSLEEAEEMLQQESLTCITVGNGETVTGQIPMADSLLPGTSEVILYMGEDVPTDKVVVPNFSNMGRSAANTEAVNSGLYLQTKGSSQPHAVVTSQDYEPGAEVPRGTTITVELTDRTAQD